MTVGVMSASGPLETHRNVSDLFAIRGQADIGPAGSTSRLYEYTA
jgi:hypothetical protein